MSRHLPSPFRAVAPLQRWAMLAVVLLGAFLRIWLLGDLPPGLYHDEAYNGLDALALVNGAEFPIFHEAWEQYQQDAFAEHAPEPTRAPVYFAGNYGRESLHVYGMAIAIQIFGATPLAVRLIPALAGILAIFTTYLAAAAIFDGERINRVGAGRQEMAAGSLIPLAAALALAILYPAITFSRYGVRAMLFVPLSTLAVYAFWRGYDRIKEPPDHLPSYSLAWHWFLGAGFALGVALSTSTVARLFPLVFVIFVLLWFWQDRTAWRQYGQYLILLASVALLAALPLLLYLWRYPYFLTVRSGDLMNQGLGADSERPWLMWLLNIGRVVRGFFWQGDMQLRHNLPGRPYLDVIQALFFLLGWVRVWLGRARLRFQFLPIWFGVMLLPTIFSSDAPDFGRLVGVAPVAAILIGAGVVQVWQWAGERWWPAEKEGKNRGRRQSRGQERRKLQVAVGLIALLAASGLWTGIDYFVRYTDQPGLPEAFAERDWLLGQYVAGLTPPFRAYLTPAQAEMATIYFALGGDQDLLHSFDAATTTVPLGAPGEVLVYLVAAEALAARESLFERFPESSINPLEDGFIPYTLLGSAERIPTANLTDLPLGEGISLVAWDTALAAAALNVELYWQATMSLTQPATAYVQLLAADGALVAQHDHIPAGYPTQLWRAGELVTDQFVLDLRGVPAGVYTLRTGFYDSETQQPLGDGVEFARITLP
ncbi:MAG: phospholipid carrier-dependent glycosyltransferase [Anaerolineales bacterium]|nr:phospholipid carrier-dependent glycosyltransferase [Anaerolineales bacterium]